MKIKYILFLVLALFAILIGLRIAAIRFYRIPSPAMENAIPSGSRIIVWKKNFRPKRYEIIVYKNPEQDTVTVPRSPVSYYFLSRTMNKEYIESHFKKEFVPFKQRENWIGRCVGMPGDKIELKNAILYVNDEMYTNPGIKKTYLLRTKNDVKISPEILQSYGVKENDTYSNGGFSAVIITAKQAESLKQLTETESLVMLVEHSNNYKEIFPFDDSIKFSKDCFGPVAIPEKGKEIKITMENIPFYKRIITAYEGNSLEIINNEIKINGVKAETYTPKMNYYFIVCDNRDRTLDSRYWGFLPENHVYGKILKVFN